MKPKRSSPMSYTSKDVTDNRINEFMDKLANIDAESKPSRQLLTEDPTAYIEHERKWRIRLKTLWQTEKKFLAPGKKRALSSYRDMVGLYRKKIIGLNFIRDTFQPRVLELCHYYEEYKPFLEALAANRNVESIDRTYKTISDPKKRPKNLPGELVDDLIPIQFHHPILSNARLTQTENQDLAEEAEQRLDDKHKSVIKIPINKYLYIANTILNDPSNHDYRDLAIAIVIATGRRPVEVIKLGNFIESPIKDHIFFTGQAKLKGRDFPGVDTPCIAGDLNKINAAIDILRSYVASRWGSNLTNKEVNSKTSKPINTRVKELLAETPAQQIRLDLKTLRSIYAHRSFDLHAPENWTIEVYGAEKLGHDPKDKGTIQNYKGVKLDYKPFNHKAYESKLQRANKREERSEDKKAKLFSKKIKKVEGMKDIILTASTRKGTEVSLERIYNAIIEILSDNELPTYSMIFHKLESSVSKGLIKKALDSIGNIEDL